MKAVIQRVTRAEVSVDGKTVGATGPGLLILVGVTHGDGPADAAWLAKKCAALRIFSDGEGRMNLSLLQTGGEALVVSQFTLYGDASRGNRPAFVQAADPALAESLVDQFVAVLGGELGQARVRTGIFGAMMKVSLENDGPVTIILDSSRTPGPPG
jgi:D-tyrosyl-tRNA(Tyr) deacylase